MRVIAGSARSLRLRVPRGPDIRPTTDAMRESLFASLWGRVEGCRFADLYAGCGSVGIEALSRRADFCLFVEKDRRCVEAIRANLQTAHLSDQAAVTQGAVEKLWPALAERHGPFDIVFLDPPYGLRGLAEFTRELVQGRSGLAPEGLVIVQCGVEAAGEEMPECARLRRFGETELRFYEENSEA